MYYIQTNIICILILLIIYLTLRRNNTLPARRIAFNKLLLAIAAVCISDIFAWCFSGKPIAGGSTVVQISNIVYFASITWTGYAWLNYVELRIKSLDYNYKKRRLICAVPLIVMLLLLVTNPVSKLMFTVDESNRYARQNGVFIHWIISWFYLVYATIEVLAKIRKATSRVEKEQFIPMLWFIVPPAVAALVQMFLYGVTSTQCGMTLAALIIAINFMVDEVSKDSLTGLNNRRALENSIVERLQRSSAKLTILMCDVDKFKSINDTLGHTAGDLVLKRMAEALKKACSNESRDLFLCRYGGDEFVICGPDMEKDDVTAFISKIEKTIESVNGEYKNELAFGISVGEATGICTSYRDAEALISMADAIMYEVKQAKNAGR